MPGVLRALQLNDNIYVCVHVFQVLCKRRWTNVIENSCQLVIVRAIKNWLLFFILVLARWIEAVLSIIAEGDGHQQSNCELGLSLSLVGGM